MKQTIRTNQADLTEGMIYNLVALSNNWHTNISSKIWSISEGSLIRIWKSIFSFSLIHFLEFINYIKKYT